MTFFLSGGLRDACLRKCEKVKVAVRPFLFFFFGLDANEVIGYRGVV